MLGKKKVWGPGFRSLASVGKPDLVVFTYPYAREGEERGVLPGVLVSSLK